MKKKTSFKVEDKEDKIPSDAKVVFTTNSGKFEIFHHKDGIMLLKVFESIDTGISIYPQSQIDPKGCNKFFIK